MSRLQVATTNLGGVEVTFWLSGEGYSKLTSLCPCPLWMVKPGLDEKKAMFLSSFEEKTFDFADAWLGRLLEVGPCLLAHPFTLCSIMHASWQAWPAASCSPLHPCHHLPTGGDVGVPVLFQSITEIMFE